MTSAESRLPVVDAVASGQFLHADALNDPRFPEAVGSVVELGLSPDNRLAVNGLMRSLNYRHVSLLNAVGVIGREQYVPKEAFYDLGFGDGLLTRRTLNSGFSKAMNHLKWVLSRPDGGCLIDQQTREGRRALYALSADAFFVEYMSREALIDPADVRNQANELTINKRRSVAEVFHR